MRINSLITAVLVGLSATACTPIIHELRVIDANNNAAYEHDEVLTVETDVTVKSGGAGTPIVYTRPHFPADSNYQRSAELPDKTLIGNNNGYDQFMFSGQLNLDYGAYDLRVSVPYSAWLTRQHVSTSTSLYVEGPDYCFTFDNHSSMGFNMGPVRHRNGTELPGNVILGTKLLNWPEDASGHGSISFDIDNQNFPQPPEETSYWFIDFISPDLSQIDAWQQSQGLSFRLSSGAVSLYAQPVVYIQGHNDPFAPKDLASDRFLVYPISTESINAQRVWNVIQWSSSPDLPEGVRERVHIRILGDANATTLNNHATVFLDAVCPMPPEISPPGGVVISPILKPME